MVTIYFLYFKEKPNKGYIGITTKNLEKRKAGHLRDAKIKNTRKSKWIRFNLKMGRDLIIIALDTCDYNIALNKEIEYISTYKQLGFKLYNSNNGGGGKLKHSEETKKKISRANLGRKLTEEQYGKLLASIKTKKPMNKLSIAAGAITRTGKPLSEEHKRKLKENHKGNTGRKFTEEHKRKISEANKGRKVGPQSLERRLKTSGINNKQSIPVRGINQITKEVIEFNSAGEAYRYMNSLGIKVSKSGIYHNISGRRNTAGGYIWSVIEDYK